MTVDTPQTQRRIAKWTLAAAIPLGGLTYLLGMKTFAYGLGFGVVLSIVNYRVIGVILDVAFRLTSHDTAKIISFLSYHIRFWLIVLVLYIVIPNTGFGFAVGTFAGILLAKIVMGVFVVLAPSEELDKKIAVTKTTTTEHRQVRDEGLRFPGLDFDDRFKNDPRFHHPNGKI